MSICSGGGLAIEMALAAELLGRFSVALVVVDAGVGFDDLSSVLVDDDGS